MSQYDYQGQNYDATAPANEHRPTQGFEWPARAERFWLAVYALLLVWWLFF